jgi:sucrose phosphorylase
MKTQIPNKTILITYPDSLGKNLKSLQSALKTLGNSVGGVHILPPYPSSGDRGFAPLTHLEIDSKFGDWREIASISKTHTLSLDLVLNHISKDSKEFKDYLKNGENSKYKEYFINIQRDFPELLDPEYTWEIRRPRPTPPYLEFEMGKDKLPTKIWCTFSTEDIHEQVDLNYNTPQVYDLMESYIRKLCENGVKLIRLDAAPHVIKKIGSDCFFVPETWVLVNWVRAIAAEYGAEILLEVHGEAVLQIEISEHDCWVYDFALPLLVLHTLQTKNCTRLLEWLSVCPLNQFTTLDTHDGIGVVDVSGILTQDETDAVVNHTKVSGGKTPLKASGNSSHNFDIYQLNTTYYSALDCDDQAYLLARAIQFFTPGVPMVYYVGLLAGENDLELLDKTHNGRDINRHNYTLLEFKKHLKKPVVQKLLKLMKMRNTCDAFDGEFTIQKPSLSECNLIWKTDTSTAELQVNLSNMTFEIYLDGLVEVF